MADGGIHEGISDEVRVPMCQLHNLAIELYCQKHDKPVCRTCKLMEHRQCQLQNLEQAAAKTRSDGRNAVVLEQLREINSKMEKIGTVLGDGKEILKSYKTTAIEEIERTMKEIEVLGRKKIAEVEDIFKQENKILDEETRALAESKFLVEKSINELETAANVGSEEEIFVATKTAERDVSKFEDIVDESRHLSQAEITFTVDPRLADVKTIGEMSVERRSVTVDVTPEVSEVLNTKGTLILWFDMLSSDRMITLNSYTKELGDTIQLRLYDTKNKLLSKLNMPETRSADMLNDHQVIVPQIKHQKLQVVNINSDDLTTGPVISTDVVPLLILKYSDNSVLVLAVYEPEGKCCFRVLNLSGKVEKNIKLSTKLGGPGFMRINNEKNVVYIVDTNGCLGLNMNGDEIFHYTSTDYDFYFGLAVDSRGALYFSAKKKADDVLSCVIKLSPAGQVLRQLDIRRKYPLQCIGNKLYLGNTGNVFCLDV